MDDDIYYFIVQRAKDNWHCQYFKFTHITQPVNWTNILGLRLESTGTSGICKSENECLEFLIEATSHYFSDSNKSPTFRNLTKPSA